MGGCNDVLKESFIADWEISLAVMTFLKELSLRNPENWQV